MEVRHHVMPAIVMDTSSQKKEIVITLLKYFLFFFLVMEFYKKTDYNSEIIIIAGIMTYLALQYTESKV